MGLKNLTFDFIDASRQAKTPEDLLDQTLKCCAYFEVEGVFVADVPDPEESITPHILLKGWNPAWIDRYAVKGYVHLDPVALALKTNKEPYLWSEACDRRLERHEMTVMGEAKEHGLESGISVPIEDMDGRLSCVSFAGRDLSLDNARRGALGLVASYTLTRLRELRAGKEIRLSPRETECLLWASVGKSYAQTGEILSLAEETAREYVGTAVRKLGAENKIQAVAEALRRGLIH